MTPIEMAGDDLAEEILLEFRECDTREERCIVAAMYGFPWIPTREEVYAFAASLMRDVYCTAFPLGVSP